MASLTARLTRAVLRSQVQPTFTPGFGLERQRRRLNTLQQLMPMPFGVRRQITPCGGVPAWRLTPTSVQDAGHAQHAETSVMLYLHGGGYIVGSPTSHGEMVARIARQCGLDSWLIDYRLAPEHPAPAALEDALSAYRTLCTQGPVIIAGDSAGGGLSLALTAAIIRLQLPRPKALVLFSPWADLSCSGASICEREQREVMLKTDWLRFAAEHYAGDQDLDSPHVSPLHADFSGFPPTLIQVGSEEILYDDSVRLAQRMRHAGVDVTLSEYPHMWHVFQLHAAYMPEARKALNEMAAFTSKC
ncbi:MAG: alpha/beta hydrolase [Saccharospirillaceae bacterium]|nr:alpha/beta hydrolase [Saccharospirillaceae bacterium]MCD8529927.1 alpha/beta hydrolase [Saccharospirillaceae bacterium]